MKPNMKKIPNTAKAFYTIDAKTAAALKMRALYASDFSPFSRAAFLIDGSVQRAARGDSHTNKSYIRAANSINAQFTAAAIAARTDKHNSNGMHTNAAHIDMQGFTQAERRMFAAHMARKHAAALAQGHAPKAATLAITSGAPSLLESSIRAARVALKVAARGGKVKKGASNNGNDKARAMLAAFAYDVRAMLDNGMYNHVMSDACDFISVAAQTFIDNGVWDAENDMVDVARVMGMDKNGKDITAFCVALRACHAYIYSNRSVRGRSARAVYLDAQEGNTDAIVCAAGLLENPIAQWEGQEHVSAILRDIAAIVGEKRARIAQRLYQGYTQDEIARELHISQAAVSKNLAVIRRAFIDMQARA